MKKYIKSPLKAILSKGLIIAASTLLFMCDTFQEDQIKEAEQLPTKNDIVVLKNTPAVVDFSDLFTINEEINLQITKSPQIGTLGHLGDVLYKYTPETDASGRDYIIFKVFNKTNQFLFSDSLNIDIVTDLGDTCAFYAIPDQYDIKPDSSTVLSVMNNDVICHESDSISLTVLKMPNHGTIRIENNKTIYHTTVLSGVDEFVYQISNRYDEPISSKAIVTLNIAESSCHLIVNNDNVDYNPGSATYSLNVLVNDQLCDGTVRLEVLKQPTHGTASFDENNQIIYEITENEEMPFTDSLRYQVCQNGQCGEANVVINISGEECDILEVNDDVASYNLDIPNLKVIILDNDVVCTDSIVSTISKQATKGVASIDENHYLSYVTNDETLTPYVDSVYYKICQGTYCAEAKVILNVYSGNCANLDAIDDTVTISDSTQVDGKYRIDVTSNDSYCGNLNIKIISAPTNGTANTDEFDIIYTPGSANIEDDELTYELCDDSNQCDQAVVSINGEN